ncbi:MAG: T9SS type A sorting domain-containing protein [Chitinophagales bacterium]|nr:T9SS type A sorting domain-containing protein [Bacteroidota bacterium]MCB9042588.1 T9SS type A sorting domain-containing protein [Chitinophagales bacterium]
MLKLNINNLVRAYVFVFFVCAGQLFTSLVQAQIIAPIEEDDLTTDPFEWNNLPTEENLLILNPVFDLGDIEEEAGKECAVKTFKVTPYNCGDGTVDIILDFTISNEEILPNESFSLRLNNSYPETFTYAQLPVTLHEILANNKISHRIEIFDESKNCRSTFDIPAVGCLYPGDINEDGFVNNEDILYTGLAFGESGISRPNATTNYEKQAAFNWNKSFLEQNYKFADCNGDGTINLQDVAVVDKNYQNNAQSIGSAVNADEGNPAIYLGLEPYLEAGTPLNVPIYLGSENLPLNDIYGIAFTVNYDFELIVENSIMVDFQDCWLGNSQDLISYYKSDTFGKIDVVVVRKTHTNISGFGSLAKISAVLIENVEKIGAEKNFKMGVSNVHALSFDETIIPVYQKELDPSIVTTPTGLDNIASLAGVSVYPNPVASKLYVNIPAEMKNAQLVLYNLSGAKVFDYNLLKQNNELNVASLHQGVYTLVLRTPEKTTYQKLVISR